MPGSFPLILIVALLILAYYINSRGKAKQAPTEKITYIYLYSAAGKVVSSYTVMEITSVDTNGNVTTAPYRGQIINRGYRTITFRDSNDNKVEWNGDYLVTEAPLPKATTT